MDFIKRLTRMSYSKSTVIENREKYLAMSLDEKRKLYKCRNDFITLDKIKTWPEYYQEHNLNEAEKPIASIETVNEILNSKIGIIIGDITCLEIDCIVNAAKKTLLGGGGVDGAIHSAAGPLLYSECEALNGCKTSEAKITSGYNLPAKYCIHTVGPIGYYPKELKKAYLSCLDLAVDNNCRSIAFPCISTGIYGFPNDKAAQIVAQTLREYLEINHEKFDRIILCLFMEKDITLYHDFLQVFFPISEKPTTKVQNEEDNTKEELKLIPEPSKPEIETEFEKEKTVLTQSDEAIVPNAVKIEENITKDEASTSSEAAKEIKKPAISDEKHLEESITQEDSNETKNSQ